VTLYGTTGKRRKLAQRVHSRMNLEYPCHRKWKMDTGATSTVMAVISKKAYADGGAHKTLGVSGAA